jgi:hypothetical protein
MLVECNKCKKEILTECNTYIVIPTQNYAINCGCELLQKEQQLEKENAMMREALEKALSGSELYVKFADCNRDSWACRCEFCRDTTSKIKLREAREVLAKINKGE